MAILRSLLVAAGLVALSPTSSLDQAGISQAERAQLRGLDTMDVVIGALSDDAGPCHVLADELRASASSALADAGITVRSDILDTPAYLHVNATVSILPPSGCLTNLDVEAYTEAPATLPHSPDDVAVRSRIKLWGAGFLMTGPAPGFGARVNAQVREFAATFAALVGLANEPQAEPGDERR